MSDGLSRDEFYRGLDGLKVDLRSEVRDAEARLGEDLRGVNQRLDVLNGRTGRMEIEQATMKQRATNLEKEVFHRPRRRADEISERKPMTKQDAGVVAIALMALTVCVKLLMMFGTFIVDLGKVALQKP